MSSVLITSDATVNTYIEFFGSIISISSVLDVIGKLKKVASENSIRDNEEFFCVGDFTDGNVDDAFYMGENAGTIELARSMLDLLNVNY